MRTFDHPTNERSRVVIALVILLALVLGAPVLADDDEEEEIAELKERVSKLEVKAAQDRVRFTGDLRVTADSIDATLAERYDGLALQKGTLDTFFYIQGNGGAIPGSLDDVGQFIQENYADYLYFQDTLTFDQVKEIFGGLPEFIGSLPPADQQALAQYLGQLQQATYSPEQEYKNDIIYTTRVRLNMDADVQKGTYTLSVDAPTGACLLDRCYRLRATPEGVQADDACGPLTLDSERIKAPTNCW